jgi:hypothetical protein
VHVVSTLVPDLKEITGLKDAYELDPNPDSVNDGDTGVELNP